MGGGHRLLHTQIHWLFFSDSDGVLEDSGKSEYRWVLKCLFKCIVRFKKKTYKSYSSSTSRLNKKLLLDSPIHTLYVDEGILFAELLYSDSRENFLGGKSHISAADYSWWH